jgi:hypothetical protein
VSRKFRLKAGLQLEAAQLNPCASSDDERADTGDSPIPVIDIISS